MNMSEQAILSPRDGFGTALLELGESNKKIIVLSADLKESTRTQAFASRFPNRHIEIGVAEQNMMGIAVGLAEEGWIPLCVSFAVFNPGRNWDQFRVGVAYNKANVKVIGAHCGLSAGGDGATHQALEDIAITRVLPNMTVLAPADAYETKAAIAAAIELDGPVYLRLSRTADPIVLKSSAEFIIGKAKKIQSGTDITVCVTGSSYYSTKKALDKIKDKVSVELLHFPTIKPFDVEALIKSARKTKAVVTVEEAQVAGGFGGLIAEILGEKLPTRIKRVGVNDSFGESGDKDALRAKYSIDEDAIAAAILGLRIKKAG